MTALSLGGPAARAQTRDIGVHGEMLDRIAAVVNEGLVLKSELDAQMDSVTKRLQEQKVELPSQSVLKQQVLDRLILQEIQAQRAKRVGLTISDEQLNGALQEIAQRNKIPFDQLPTALEAQGVDYKQYRESMRKELTLSTLRQRDVIAHINVTPRELDQYLTRQQTSAANDESWSTMMLIVFFSSRISPFTSTVIFLDRSPLATAVVTSAMFLTWAVRLDAM